MYLKYDKKKQMGKDLKETEIWKCTTEEACDVSWVLK
jgi:hypothetical protein